jgi:hypothetical protein
LAEVELKTVMALFAGLSTYLLLIIKQSSITIQFSFTQTDKLNYQQPMKKVQDATKVVFQAIALFYR